MDCLLKVIKGPDAGAQVELKNGPTLVGRSPRAQLRLTPDDVSWEHAVIHRDGDEYTLENLSALGTWIDGERITRPIKVRHKDQFRLTADTVLRIEAVNAQALRVRALLWWLVGLGVLAVVGLVVWEVVKPQPPADDWNHAYSLIVPYLDNEVRLGRLSDEVRVLFREAWRLDLAGNHQASLDRWLRLKVLINTRAMPPDFAEAPRRPNALNRLLRPRGADAVDPEPSDLAAAFVQFVDRRYVYAAAVSGKKSKGFLK